MAKRDITHCSGHNVVCGIHGRPHEICSMARDIIVGLSIITIALPLAILAIVIGDWFYTFLVLF